MTIDPVELERLSKAAEQEDDDVHYYGGPTSTHRPARDAYHAALVQLHRTGQLVPAQPSDYLTRAHAQIASGQSKENIELDGALITQPSGDVVEAVGMALCENALGGKACPCKESGVFKCHDAYPGYQATAAITAYEAVSGVAKMREALEYYAKDYDYERGCSQWDGGALARAALGEKP